MDFRPVISIYQRPSHDQIILHSESHFAAIHAILNKNTDDKLDAVVMIIIIPLIIVVGVLMWTLRPGKSPSRSRIVAILATALPPLVVAIAAVVFQLLHNAAGRTWVSDISNTCFIVSIGLVGAAIVAAVGYTIARKGEIAKGMGFGICIGLLLSIIELFLLEWLGGV